MKIEHVAYQVEHTPEAADWYCEHLGFQVKRSGDDPIPVRFIADESGTVMLEIYNNPAAPIPDYASMDPLVLHIAFVCPDLQGTLERLVAAGATLVSGPETTPAGDELAMLRDPWGLSIQLCKRGEPMIKKDLFGRAVLETPIFYRSSWDRSNPVISKGDGTMSQRKFLSSTLIQRRFSGRFLIFVLLGAVLAPGAGWADEQPVYPKEEVSDIMKRVCDWQLANLPKFTPIRNRMTAIEPNGWIRAAFFTGVMATYQATQDEKYLDAAIAHSERNLWMPAPRHRHGDDHAIAQTYLEIYNVKKDPKMILFIKATYDDIIDNPFPVPFDEVMTKGSAPPDASVRAYWSWCDALFMAPPVLARLTHATGDSKYIDHMNKWWWEATDHLYDPEESLYYRDLRYKVYEDGSGRRTPNGNKVFWSRGNGWVMGGLVRVLQYMPEDYPDRPKYIQLFKDMSAKIASLQGEDGLWRSSLLDYEAFPDPETSGTGFYCYALAYGINAGILDKATYLSSVKKAWDALVRSTSITGKLGWVQRVGRDPKKVNWDDNMEYATGAMLLAGSEVMKLTEDPDQAAEPRGSGSVVVKAANGLDLVRDNETISLAWADLLAEAPSLSAEYVAVKDQSSGKVLVSQTIDLNEDGTIDELIFQSNFGPKESKSFLVDQSGPGEAPTSKVLAKLVPTRYDDFAWENDRVAFRMYGPELQFTPNSKQRLKCSGIDAWAKKVRHLIVEKWYADGDYHADHGEGADFYKVGPTRGCGGVGIWDGEKVHVSGNFVRYDILANGPIRTVFQFRFRPYDVNGTIMSEVKRITLDAGQNLNKVESTFRSSGERGEDINFVIGIVKREGVAPEQNESAGILRTWEPIVAGGESQGNQGCGVVIDPSQLVKFVEGDTDHLIVAKAKSRKAATFYTGSCWDKSEDFSGVADWDAYLSEWSQRIVSPLEVSIAKN